MRIIIQKIGRSEDIIIAILLLIIVGLIIIKLPTFIMDILLITSICISVLIFLIAILIRKPIEFSIFPTILLLATLFRLALNISALRLILLDGHRGETGVGYVIATAGKLTIGGNLIAGLIFLSIIIFVDFIFITTATERVAQVGARFTLDCPPRCCHPISDVEMGLISPEEAKARRIQVQMEADFYGGMDGLGKFVKGEALASVIIIAISLVGGILSGILRQGMPAGEALVHYGTLSIGNGFLSTISAFLVSIAMGMVVSRVASDAGLGRDVWKQITAHPETLLIIGNVMLIFYELVITKVINCPAFPFLFLAIFCKILWWVLRKHYKELDNRIKEESKEKTSQEENKKPANVVALRNPEPISIEIGRKLLPFVDPNQGAKLIDAVSCMRRHMTMEMGITIPGIRVKDNLQLDPGVYVIKIKNLEVAAGEIVFDRFLAIGPENKLNALRGLRCFEPVYDMPAVWITKDQIEEAERAGCMIFDPVKVIVSHITEVIRNRAADLIGLQQVADLLEKVRKTHPAVVQDIYQALYTEEEIQKVLQNLLKEKVSIRDIITILETLGDYAHITNDLDMLSEYVRYALCRVISGKYQNNEGVIKVITLDPELENVIAGAIQSTEHGSFLSLYPETGQLFLTDLGEDIQVVEKEGMEPIVLCSPKIRFYLRRITEKIFPDLVVLSYNDIAPKAKVVSVRMSGLSVVGGSNLV